MSARTRVALFVALAASLALLVPLQRTIDDRFAEAAAVDEALYLTSGDHVRHLGLGYDTLLADVYWMRAIQYFGAKSIANRSLPESERTQPVLLYPLLEVTTTLDPHYIEPFRFGGFFLHDFVDEQRGYEILHKGIRANPENLNLHLDLAFLYWNSGDCESASVAYAEASRVPGAASWVSEMPAVVLAECGKRDFAIRMLQRMYESSSDPRVREDIESRILGYLALDDIDALAESVRQYESTYGGRPQSLTILTRTVRIPPGPGGRRVRIDVSGQPLDPNGTPYVYDSATGAITTVPESIVLPKPVMKRYGRSGHGT